MTPQESATQVWRQAARVLALQGALAALAAVLAAVIWGPGAGGWALAGGAVCIVPSAIFGFQLARAARRSGSAFVLAFVLGELLKVLLVGSLFVLVFSLFGGANAAALLLGFVAAIQGYFLALLFS